MEESFDLIAQTRANYYTPGSPVQFVRVELLRGNQSGDNAVCLTFKNISQVMLTALDIMFKCKNAAGDVLCEDSFEYRGLQVRPGQLFGMDDAVFITQEPISSVDVILKNVYNEQRVVRLDNAKRVRLPAPRRLTDELQTALCAHMGRKGLRYAPQMMDNGWYCACGAFHPKEEDTVYCSECGCDRILLQNALNNLMQPRNNAAKAEDGQTKQVAEVPTQQQPSQQTQHSQYSEDPTRIVGAEKQSAAESEGEVGGTRTFIPPQRDAEPVNEAVDEPTIAPQVQERAEEKTRYCPIAPMQESDEEPEPTVLPPVEDIEPDDEDEDDEEEERDVLSENIIRWVPPVAALLCAGIALSGFVYCRFLL